MRRTPLLLAIALAVFGASACDTTESVNPVTKAERTSPAETWGVATTELPDGPEEQALLALEQDAFRREQRFFDAAQPGYAFRSTRVDQAEIDLGLWSNEEMYQLGAQLFQLTFTRADGFGGKDLPPLGRFHTGRRGGPDARKCAACHWRGGPAGSGDGADNAYLDGDGDAQSSALARNPPPLTGVGWIEILGREMTEELTVQRDKAIAFAKEKGAAVDIGLASKGVKFGVLRIGPDGALDTSKVEGIDADLTVRPFGWKGTFASLRDVAEDSLLVHHGMESDYLVGSAGPERVGAFGGLDPDGDGVTSEISEGQVSALTLFLAMQEVPAEVPPDDSDFMLVYATGIERFKDIGCASCHVPSLPAKSPVYELPGRDSGASVRVDLTREAAMPRLTAAKETGSLDVRLFSDLKRHDLGQANAEARSDRGVEGRLFLTRPLWGIARSRPYLHDGHAPTLEDAILLHGGEAQSARDAYNALADEDRAPIRMFLMTLTRTRRMSVP